MTGQDTRRKSDGVFVRMSVLLILPRLDLASNQPE